MDLHFRSTTLKMNWFNQKEARAGLAECVKFDHFQPYPVLLEKSKYPVAHFKWTVAVSNKRVLLISSSQTLNFELSKPKNELKDDLKKLFDVK